MPVLTMNVPCKVTSRNGSDEYGDPRWGLSFNERCAVIKLINKTKRTTVRADSSGSRGHAQEEVADAMFLVSKNTKIELEDRIEVAGIKLIVEWKQPRFNVMSRLDHYEIGCKIE